MTADALRTLAEQVENGEIDGYALAVVVDGETHHIFDGAIDLALVGEVGQLQQQLHTLIAAARSGSQTEH